MRFSLNLHNVIHWMAIARVVAIPNIMFVLIDDLGWNDLSYHQGSDFASPNIDKLAANSLQLHNYYVQHICSPTRSALHTGRYPIHTGLQHSVISPPSPYGVPLNLTMLPQDLKRAGYKTHMIGKWHNGFFTPRYLPTSRGYDTFFGYYIGAEDYYNHNRSYDGISGYDLRNFTTPISRPKQYSTYLYGNETMRILKHYDNTRNPDPFYIYLSFQAVHTPLEAPQYIINSFNTSISSSNRRKKAAMVTVLDDVIGQMLDFLQYQSKSHLWDNLLLILSTDNGGPSSDGAANNFPLRGSKASLWEGGVRGIGFVAGGWLNDERRSKQMNALMHITDWYPTLCEIAGVKPSNASLLDGYSQLNNIQNGDTDNIYTPRAEIVHNIDMQSCGLNVCGAIRMKQYKLVVGQEVDSEQKCQASWCPLNDANQNETTVKCTANEGNYNYPNITELIQNGSCPFNGEACLYNIENDPCEYYDIKHENEDVYHALYQRLLYYNSTAVEPLNILYPPNTSAANPQNLGGFWGPWVNNTNFTKKLEL